MFESLLGKKARSRASWLSHVSSVSCSRNLVWQNHPLYVLPLLTAGSVGDSGTYEAAPLHSVVHQPDLEISRRGQNA